MEEKRKCINCMSDMQPGEIVCRKCGFDSRNIDQPIYALPCNCLLHGRYIIGKVLGQGGFGITYLAWDNLLDMKVAVKEYYPMGMVTRDVSRSTSLLWSMSQSDYMQRQKGYDRFLKEARKMAKIDNIPSIVRVRDFFPDNETAYIVMDFVEGITLKDSLLKSGILSFEACVRLLHPIMEGLAKAHSHQIIHRDISPDNIMIQRDGSVVLLDLGAAKDMTDANGQKSQLVAKSGFSPIEQYMQNKPIGTWTDVYALCATIYYCVTGKVLKTALDRLEDGTVWFPPEMDGSISEKEKNVLRDGLALKPEERIRDVGELLRRLDEAVRKEKQAQAAKMPEREEKTVQKPVQEETKTAEMEKDEDAVEFDVTLKRRYINRSKMYRESKVLQKMVKGTVASIAGAVFIGLFIAVRFRKSGSFLELVFLVSILCLPAFLGVVYLCIFDYIKQFFQPYAHYTVNDKEIIYVPNKGKAKVVLWNMVTKMRFEENFIFVEGYGRLLINTVYYRKQKFFSCAIPKNQLGKEYEALLRIAKKNLPENKLKVK